MPRMPGLIIVRPETSRAELRRGANFEACGLLGRFVCLALAVRQIGQRVDPRALRLEDRLEVGQGVYACRLLSR